MIMAGLYCNSDSAGWKLIYKFYLRGIQLSFPYLIKATHTIIIKVP